MALHWRILHATYANCKQMWSNRIINDLKRQGSRKEEKDDDYDENALPFSWVVILDAYFLVSLKISAINHGNFELGRAQESKWHRTLEFLSFFTRELARIHWYVSIQDTWVSAAIKQNDTISSWMYASSKSDVCTINVFTRRRIITDILHAIPFVAMHDFFEFAWVVIFASVIQIACMCVWFQLWMFIWSLNLK